MHHEITAEIPTESIHLLRITPCAIARHTIKPSQFIIDVLIVGGRNSIPEQRDGVVTNRIHS